MRSRRPWISLGIGVLVFVACTSISHAVSSSGPAGQGSVFLPVGNGYVDGCDVTRVGTALKDIDARSDVTDIEPVVYVVLENGTRVALPAGTDPSFVASEIANNDCR
jgi:hypothetical protein